jgi:TnpA family transposase
VINAFAKLDVAGVWGDGQVVAADGSQIDTWENNLLAESHIRYGGFGGLAMRHISDTYIALFSHLSRAGYGRRSTSSRACCRTPPTCSRT